MVGVCHTEKLGCEFMYSKSTQGKCLKLRTIM